MFNHSDSVWMERALQLASFGLGKVQPNPMVGCVIVYKNQIIGEGWHHKYGEPHAEVNAINSVKDKSLLSKSTLFVNLEPCSHYGQTPPCSELICKHKIARVVIANKDPNEKVNGNGIKQLINAGIDVTVGVLADEGIKLNKRFFTYHLLKRPYIILKWAETKNGYIDIQREQTPDFYWISNQELKVFSHKLRNEEQAILIGYNTLLNDQPKLTNRLFGTHQPYPFVASNNVLNTPPTTFTIIPNDVNNMLSELHLRKIQSVIIEGGKKTIQQFIDAEIWDEAVVYTGDQEWEDGLLGPKIDESHPKMVYKETQISNNVLKHYTSESHLISNFSDFLSHV